VGGSGGWGLGPQPPPPNPQSPIPNPHIMRKVYLPNIEKNKFFIYFIKMEAKLMFIAIQIILVYSSTVYPAEDIWMKLKYRAASGMMVYNKNYFIYDDKNYTKLDIHGKKMNDLYQKQYNTYINNNYLSNYIFVIESLDETEQTLESFADQLSEYIKLDLDYYYKHNYILAVFVIKSHKVKFYAGTTAITKLTKNKHDKILSDIKSYMRSEEYYKAWKKVIEDYDYYYRSDLGSSGSLDFSGGSLLWLWIVLGVIALVLIIIICSKLDINNGRFSYNSYGGDNDRNSYKSYGRVSNDRNSYGGGRNSVASGGGGGSW